MAEGKGGLCRGGCVWSRGGGCIDCLWEWYSRRSRWWWAESRWLKVWGGGYVGVAVCAVEVEVIPIVGGCGTVVGVGGGGGGGCGKGVD